MTLAILAIIAAAVGLVGLLIWSQIEVKKQTKPMIGPGRFSDAAQTYTFQISEGWKVIHRKSQTQVVREDGTLPNYDLEARSMQQMNLVVNWSCLTLADFVPDVVKAIAPWEVTITYVSVPCSENAAEAALVRVYVTLNDGSGRKAVLAYAPLDGVTWVVARTVPFEGESSADLTAALTQSVTTAQRRK
jgi:hypothetical protein